MFDGLVEGGTVMEQHKNDIKLGRFLSTIQTEGIKRMNRQYVHLSPDYQTAIAVGRRYGVPVVLRVEAGAMAQSGTTFFLSENGVWLCEYVPPEYFHVVEGNS